jgi:hypothetical protein
MRTGSAARMLGTAAAVGPLFASGGCAAEQSAQERTAPDADGESDGASVSAIVDGVAVPADRLDPTDFVAAIDNPFSPMLPGMSWTYRSAGSEGAETIVVTVTHRTRIVDGVRATVVRDVVTTRDGVVEDTYDWFAQDTAGNVWYLGEDTTAYEDGRASKEGSWEAGEDGAKAGIVMLADPDVGDAYQQEYYPGEAEDRGEVLAVDAAVRIPLGRFTGLVKTADTTPLEPEVVEHKYYAEGVGLVYEEGISGGDDRVRLVRVQPAAARSSASTGPSPSSAR